MFEQMLTRRIVKYLGLLRSDAMENHLCVCAYENGRIIPVEAYGGGGGGGGSWNS